MMDYLQPLVNYIHQHPNIGTLAAFLIAFAESLPLIGTIVPGSITMTAIGMLVGAAILPGISTLGWASLGAFVGDTIGFWLGYQFHHSIPKLWPFRTHPSWLEKSKRFFDKHGGKSIIIGRFVGPARSTVPLVAGLLHMKWLRFIAAAIPSAILWALLYMTPGILLGALALELPPHVATEFVLIGLIVILGLWLVFWALQYFFAQLAHLINVFVDKLWDRLIRYSGSRLFIRFIAVKGRPTDHYQLTLVLVATLALLVFIWLGFSVVNNTAITDINLPIFYLFQSLRSTTLNHFFIGVTFLGATTTTLPAAALISIGLAWMRQWRASLHFIGLMVITSGAVLFIKHTWYNLRPVGFQYVKSSSSFPSGHTILAFVTFSYLAYLTGKLCPNRRWIPYTTASVSILFVGISRLYLGAHWCTDILGSFLLGLTLLLSTIMYYRRDGKQRFKKTMRLGPWLLLLFSSLLLTWCVSTVRGYRFAEYQYTPVWPEIEMSMQQWWKNPIDFLPVYRINRFGEPIQPFNVQWAGRIKTISRLLKQYGWQEADPRYTMKNALYRFTTKKPEYHLPLLPWLYHHKAPVLIMIRHAKHGASIIELRLWDSGTAFNNSTTPLWLGTVNFHRTPARMFTLHRFRKEISLKKGGGLNQITQLLRSPKNTTYQYKTLQVSDKKQPKKVHLLDWDGQILVIHPRIP